MSNIRYEWSRRRGGLRPQFVLRQYGAWSHPFDVGFRAYSPVVGVLSLTSPKRQKWHVEFTKGHGLITLAHLSRMSQEEAMDAAKLLIVGNVQ